MVSSIATLALLGAAALVQAVLPNGRPNGNVAPRPSVPKVLAKDTPITDVKGAALPPLTTVYNFQQLVDHNNPSAGTFSQRYWTTWQFWKTGGCVVLFTPGESDADGYTGYLTNVTINGQIAQQHNCATVVIEHRFFGLSNPKPDLTTQSLQLLTIQQSVLDLDYFAKNVKLPMPGGDQVTPDVTPWVLVGGSYSGALTSWTMSQVNSFYAGYASSAVVEAITDFWGYFEPIRQQMPQNCSADVEAVVSYIDSVFTNGTTTQQNSIKSSFGLTSLTHLDDVAGALRSNLWDWQSVQPDSGANTEFRKFCDALEVANGTSAPASGWGLNHALPAWGKYWTSYYIKETCGTLDVTDCFSTYQSTSSQYTSTAVNNAGRSWTWFTCNEVGFFQDAAPTTSPTLVSRLVQPAGDLRQCSYYFPQHGVTPPTTNNTNVRFEGWNANIPRIFYGTGRNDPWRESTVIAAGSPFQNTTSHPVGLSDGYHCSDLLTSEGTHDSSVFAVQQQGLAAMSRWLPTFQPTAKRASW